MVEVVLYLTVEFVIPVQGSSEDKIEFDISTMFSMNFSSKNIFSCYMFYFDFCVNIRVLLQSADFIVKKCFALAEY